MAKPTPSNGTTIKFEGQRRLARQLKTLDADAPKAMRALQLESAKLVAADTKQRSPRRSGKLAKSVRAGASKFSAFVRVGSATVPYAGPIIYGWRAHNITPNPFPYQALEANREKIVAMHAVGINRLVESTITKSGPD
jgi:hypothetical protein